MKKLINKMDKRHIIQFIAAVFINSYAAGFLQGKIYKGKSKQFCLPVLNCYSCPGSRGACPIGAMQAVLGDNRHQFSFYVLGFIMLFGVLLGRLICGFLCPFGLIQDLLYKIRTPKLQIAKKVDKPLRFIKYGILIVFVILLPMFLTNRFGMGAPYFCKLICPAGTLGGGIPLLIKNEPLRKTIGLLFSWKVFLLAAVTVFSVFIYRPFCKYICPLGAFYSLFNKVSFFKMEVDQEKCTGCKLCERKCNMKVEITKNINAMECIRCLKCKSVCPQKAIASKIDLKIKEEKKHALDT